MAITRFVLENDFGYFTDDPDGFYGKLDSKRRKKRNVWKNIGEKIDIVLNSRCIAYYTVLHKSSTITYV